MTTSLLQSLEEKIDSAMEIIELQRLQIEELEEHNAKIQADFTNVKMRQDEWEQSLSTILRKLDKADLNAGKLAGAGVRSEHLEEVMA